MTLPVPTQRRQAIATGLRSTLPAGWVVYPGPAAVVATNSVVIVPGEPHRELIAGSRGERTRLVLHVTYPVPQGVDLLDADDLIVDKVLDGLDAATVSVGIAAVHQPSLGELNGAECITTRVDIDVV